LELISPSSQIQSAEEEVAIEGEELGLRTSVTVTHSHSND